MSDFTKRLNENIKNFRENAPKQIVEYIKNNCEIFSNQGFKGIYLGCDDYADFSEENIVTLTYKYREDVKKLLDELDLCIFFEYGGLEWDITENSIYDNYIGTDSIRLKILWE